MVDHRHRLHPDRLAQLRREEGLEQRRLERQHLQAVGAGSFGKEQQPVTGQQARLEKLCLHPRRGGYPLDEHRARGAREPADAGPARHLGFGDEIDPFRRVEREDVEPAGMVGHRGTARLHGCAAHAQPQPEQAQRVAADKLRDRGRHGPVHPAQWPLHQPYDQQHRQRAEHQNAQARAAYHDAQPVRHAQPRHVRMRALVPGDAHRPAPRNSRAGRPARCRVSRIMHTSVVLKA